MTKPRFVVGPPGTGKTHIFLLAKYRKFFKLYDPDKIVLISHTNTAVNEILDAVMKIAEIRQKVQLFRPCLKYQVLQSVSIGNLGTFRKIPKIW